ncbi:membrane-anchored junction protein isoform X2 [Hyla sarda]|nr:membrane-anchored junction protein isoform X2 [Hyla sarda]
MSELLDSVRAVLANHDNLQPFSTKHFIIFPYKSKWDSASCLRFKHRQKFLQPFPYVFTMYVEPRSFVNATFTTAVESSSKQESQDETQDKESCSNLENEKCQITSDSEELCGALCPTLDPGTQNPGGLLEVLKSLIPFKVLFKGGETQ